MSDASTVLPKAFPTPETFLLVAPLYERFPISGEDVWKVIDLLHYGGTYDCFCIECGRESTFRGNPLPIPPAYVRNKSVEENRKIYKIPITLPPIPHGTHALAAQCTRQYHHLHQFFFSVERGSVQKVGQLPSYGDLILPELKKYSAVLSKSQFGELKRAVSLASHDVGVGAYVYLRRIFEALVEEAHKEALHDTGWNEVAYSAGRMSEKIAVLRRHLPEFLSDHPHMYTLLSKGIHELSEEECLKHFPALRIGIELILDEKLEQREKAAKVQGAKVALAKSMSSPLTQPSVDSD
ncbi:MAG: hypothetical protein JWR22_4131 [Herminiimonas sp.]|nr:hypothetical protein [Herminiimonas sp.]